MKKIIIILLLLLYGVNKSWAQCPATVTISGVYTTTYTGSNSWIATSGATTIPAGADVTLDANPFNNGYVLMDVGFETLPNSEFLAIVLTPCSLANSTTVCLPASQDAMIHEFVPNTNYGSATILQSSKWTYTSGGGAGFYTIKALNQFDLTSLPIGAVISSATMKLYVDTTDPVYNSHRDLGGGTGNGATVYEVGSTWNESTVTWNTAPIVLGTTPSIVPALGELSTADVVVDVSLMVQNMMTTGVNNGFLTEMTDNANYYHSLVFASKENTSLGGVFQPELCVTYTVPLETKNFITNNIKVYPNPTQNLININSDSFIANIQVFDTNGRLLQNKIIQNTKSESIDLTSFEAGVYMLQIQTEVGKTFKKIVKK